MAMENCSQAQVVLPSQDLREDMAYFCNLGFRLDNIFPSDDPSVAIMSGHGLHVRLEKGALCPPATIHILSDFPECIGNGEKEFTSPSGTRFEVHPKTFDVKVPTTKHQFQVKRLKESDEWVIGRAGMLYRDLVPNRLGGSVVASHIHIPKGGPVSDMVHYHTIGFQLIFCYSGWVKVVYEDQGDPFVLWAGDCVIQPPEIRHRVLEASDHLQVIEIGVPADHMTTIDHSMTLPTKFYRPDRQFQGQKFCHHVSQNTHWSSWRIKGFECRDTGITTATAGVASAQVVRPICRGSLSKLTSHNADILFVFIVKGQVELNTEGHPSHTLSEGDSFVMPPHTPYQFLDFSADLEMLEVSLPGDFITSNHDD